MTVTYQIDPVVAVVRSFINETLTEASGLAQPLPLISAVTQYAFDPSCCPLIVLDPVATKADWSRYASGDVALSLELDLHAVRIRSGAAIGEESASIQELANLAAAFAANYRLNGNVQNVLIESLGISEPDTLHRLGIPIDEHVVIASATLKLKVIWIESYFASA